MPQGVPAGHNTIDVKYTIEEGNPSFVQRINIVGNTRTKDKVIRREVLIAPGRHLQQRAGRDDQEAAR